MRTTTNRSAKLDMTIPGKAEGMSGEQNPVFGQLKVFAGNANPTLAAEVCEHLDIPLGKANVFKFSNDNTFVQFLENIRQMDVFLIQPMSTPVNDNLMELWIMIDAARRASAGRITAVIPYYAYGRTDKKDQPRVPITGRLVADFISVAGADRVLAIDLHAGQIQGFFNIPMDELPAIPLFARRVKEMNLTDIVVTATDMGSAKRARELADLLHTPIAIIDKQRVDNDDNAKAVNLVGNVEGKEAVIIEDEIGTGGTVIEAAKTLREHGAKKIYCFATHAVLCADAPERLSNSGIDRIVVTDSLPVEGPKLIDNIEVLSVAPLIGDAIHRIHNSLSIGAMFQGAAMDEIYGASRGLDAPNG